MQAGISPKRSGAGSEKHNREVKESGEGVRIVSCLLPKQSPWLNAIEPKWVHGKRKVVEPEGLLGTYELADRVWRVFGCPQVMSTYPFPGRSPDRALREAGRGRVFIALCRE